MQVSRSSDRHTAVNAKGQQCVVREQQQETLAHSEKSGTSGESFWHHWTAIDVLPVFTPTMLPMYLFHWSEQNRQTKDRNCLLAKITGMFNL